MKRKSIFGLIAIGAIVAVTMLAGCVEKEAPASTQAPALTPTPTPSAYILITEKEGGSMLFQC